MRFVDTVCKPTKQRQSAAVDMARQADVVIVVGGRSSNNTRELVKTCARFCARVHHVQTEADVRPEWFEAAQVVGLTAGTSTPDEVIDRVEARVRLCADATAGHSATKRLIRQRLNCRSDIPEALREAGAFEAIGARRVRATLAEIGETSREPAPRSASPRWYGCCKRRAEIPFEGSQ